MTINERGRSREAPEQARAWAIVAGLAGGILIVVASLTLLLMPRWMPGFWPPMAPPEGMPYSWFPSFMYSLGVWGLLLGGAAIVAALRLRAGTENPLPWGIVLVVAGAVSLPIMGGFLVGSLLALAAGVLAIASSETGRRAGAGGMRPRGAA